MPCPAATRRTTPGAAAYAGRVRAARPTRSVTMTDCENTVGEITAASVATPELAELRRLTVPHQKRGECFTCDRRWEDIRAAAADYALRAVRVYRGLED